MTSPPKLSAVVPAVNGPALLKRCLEALGRQERSEEIEILVVARVTEDGAAISRDFPRARILDGRGLTIPQMRAAGLRQARAPVIAVLEDHTDAVETWLESLLRGHETGAAVVGGSITNGSFSLVDWAAFFTEYSQHMTPMREGTVETLPGGNCSYKRTAVEACGGLFESGVWENLLHEALRSKGFLLRCERGAEVVHSKSFTFAHFASQRWHVARSYAAMRAARATRGRRLLHAAGAAVVPALLLLRIVRNVAARQGRGYGGRLLLALPLILVFLAIGTLAEFIGYLFGEGHSTMKVV